MNPDPVYVHFWMRVPLGFLCYFEPWSTPHAGKCAMSLFPTTGRERRKEGGLEGCLLEISVLSLHSQNVITDLYITFENMVIIVESNCCVGVVSSWRHFMDGDLQCVMFLPISHLWASGPRDILCCCHCRKPDSELVTLCSHHAVSPEKLWLFFKRPQNKMHEMCYRVMNCCNAELKCGQLKWKTSHKVSCFIA